MRVLGIPAAHGACRDLRRTTTIPRMVESLPECVEIPAAGAHRWSVIWLHGLGADGHDFEPVVPELQLPDDHGVRFVFPHAPQRPVTINGGMRMRAWFDIAGPDIAAREDEPGILGSVALADALIAAEGERGIPPARVVLAGFSQGGAIACHAGLRHSEGLGGIAVLSAYLPLADRLDTGVIRPNRDTPLFQAHGAQDPVVPIDLGRMSRDRIATFRAAPEWHEYDMAHGVCAREIDDLRAWLTDTVGAF